MSRFFLIERNCFCADAPCYDGVVMPPDPIPARASEEQDAPRTQSADDPQQTVFPGPAQPPLSQQEGPAGATAVSSFAPVLPAPAPEAPTSVASPIAQAVPFQRDEKREKRAEIERQIREKKVNIEGKERDLARIVFEIGELELEIKHAAEALLVAGNALKAAESSVKKDETAVRSASEGLREKDQLLYRSRVAAEKLAREVAALKSTIAAKEHARERKNEERRALTRKRAMTGELFDRARHAVQMEKMHLHDATVEIGRLSRLPKTPINTAQKERALVEQRTIEQKLKKNQADEQKFSEEVRTMDRALVSISDELAKLEREIAADKKEIEEKEVRRAAEAEQARALTKQKEMSRQRFESGSFAKQTDEAHVAEKRVAFTRYASTVEEKRAMLDAKKREKDRIERAIFELKQDIEQLQNAMMRL